MLLSSPLPSCDLIFHILQGYFTGTLIIVWLLQCQWRNSEGYEQNCLVQIAPEYIWWWENVHNSWHVLQMFPSKGCIIIACSQLSWHPCTQCHHGSITYGKLPHQKLTNGGDLSFHWHVWLCLWKILQFSGFFFFLLPGIVVACICVCVCVITSLSTPWLFICAG